MFGKSYFRGINQVFIYVHVFFQIRDQPKFESYKYQQLFQQLLPAIYALLWFQCNPCIYYRHASRFMQLLHRDIASKIVLLLHLDDCYNLGEYYFGNISVTRSGSPCIRWENIATRLGLSLQSFWNERSWEDVGNKCRYRITCHHKYSTIYCCCMQTWLTECLTS